MEIAIRISSGGGGGVGAFTRLTGIPPCRGTSGGNRDRVAKYRRSVDYIYLATVVIRRLNTASRRYDSRTIEWKMIEISCRKRINDLRKHGGALRGWLSGFGVGFTAPRNVAPTIRTQILSGPSRTLFYLGIQSAYGRETVVAREPPMKTFRSSIG